MLLEVSKSLYRPKSRCTLRCRGFLSSKLYLWRSLLRGHQAIIICAGLGRVPYLALQTFGGIT